MKPTICTTVSHLGTQNVLPWQIVLVLGYVLVFECMHLTCKIFLHFIFSPPLNHKAQSFYHGSFWNLFENVTQLSCVNALLTTIFFWGDLCPKKLSWAAWHTRYTMHDLAHFATIWLPRKKFNTIWWLTYWHDWNYPARWPTWNLKLTVCTL